MIADIAFHVCPPVTNEVLNALFAASWTNYATRDLTHVLSHSLAYVCAYEEERLVGFVNVAWDGGLHAFLLDPTVHPDLRRQGIGRELVRQAAAAARAQGAEWLHVDYEAALEPFYRCCGFKRTEAGLMRLHVNTCAPDDRDTEHRARQVTPHPAEETSVRTRTQICHRCRCETVHTWAEWRPWYLALRRRRWMAGWICDRCGAKRFVWRIQRRRR